MVNTGINILKIIAAFCVVLLHFGDGRVKFSEVWCFSVPCFVFLSFFLTGKLFNPIDKAKLILRLKRLLLPYWFWGCIYFGLYSIFNKNFDGNKLFLQLLFGHTVCPPLYFLFILIVCTLIIWGSVLVFNKKKNLFLALLAMLCILLQYSGMNSLIWNRFGIEISCPFGRLIELYPVAYLGFFFSLLILERKKLVLLSALFLGIYFLLRIYYPVGGFGYSGAVTFGSTSICLLMIGLPFDWLEKRCGKFLSWISRAMMGVYLVHLIVGKGVQLVIPEKGLLLASITFLVSACLTLILLQFKWSSKVVR